jgi:hypothetical protein
MAMADKYPGPTLIRAGTLVDVLAGRSPENQRILVRNGRGIVGR